MLHVEQLVADICVCLESQQASLLLIRDWNRGYSDCIIMHNQNRTSETKSLTRLDSSAAPVPAQYRKPCRKRRANHQHLDQQGRSFRSHKYSSWNPDESRLDKSFLFDHEWNHDLDVYQCNPGCIWNILETNSPGDQISFPRLGSGIPLGSLKATNQHLRLAIPGTSLYHSGFILRMVRMMTPRASMTPTFLNVKKTKHHATQVERNWRRIGGTSRRIKWSSDNESMRRTACMLLQRRHCQAN